MNKIWMALFAVCFSGALLSGIVMIGLQNHSYAGQTSLDLRQAMSFHIQTMAISTMSTQQRFQIFESVKITGPIAAIAAVILFGLMRKGRR